MDPLSGPLVDPPQPYYSTTGILTSPPDLRARSIHVNLQAGPQAQTFAVLTYAKAVHCSTMPLLVESGPHRQPLADHGHLRPHGSRPLQRQRLRGRRDGRTGYDRRSGAHVGEGRELVRRARRGWRRAAGLAGPVPHGLQRGALGRTGGSAPGEPTGFGPVQVRFSPRGRPSMTAATSIAEVLVDERGLADRGRC